MLTTKDIENETKSKGKNVYTNNVVKTEILFKFGELKAKSTVSIYFTFEL